MSDPKKPDKDIVATEATEAEHITDAELDNVEGGYQLRKVMVTSYQTNSSSGAGPVGGPGPIMDTIYAGAPDDILDDDVLRKRGTMFPDPYGS